MGSNYRNRGQKDYPQIRGKESTKRKEYTMLVFLLCALLAKLPEAYSYGSTSEFLLRRK